MDHERKILSEGVPLNSECSTSIVLNTGKHTKVNSPNGTVIHLKSEQSSPDVGLHINTTLSIASSRKIKVLFVVNFLLSVVCIVISCSVAFYYWNEMSIMRRQLEAIKDQLMVQNARNPAAGSQVGQASPLVLPRPTARPRSLEEHPRRDEASPTAKKYYVDDLEEDLHFTNSRNRHSEPDVARHTPVSPKQDLVIAHFVGMGLERNLRKEAIIGPWVSDYNASSKDFARRLELSEDSKVVQIYEDGLYLMYAQIVYATNAPNCFYMWAQKSPEPPRLLTTCATGDVASPRTVRQAQISCAVQTVVRLYSGDLVNFAQREKNSTVLLNAGSSYFGFVKLSS